MKKTSLGIPLLDQRGWIWTSLPHQRSSPVCRGSMMGSYRQQCCYTDHGWHSQDRYQWGHQPSQAAGSWCPGQSVWGNSMLSVLLLLIVIKIHSKPHFLHQYIFATTVYRPSNTFSYQSCIISNFVPVLYGIAYLCISSWLWKQICHEKKYYLLFVEYHN